MNFCGIEDYYSLTSAPPPGQDHPSQALASRDVAKNPCPSHFLDDLRDRFE